MSLPDDLEAQAAALDASADAHEEQARSLRELAKTLRGAAAGLQRAEEGLRLVPDNGTMEPDMLTQAQVLAIRRRHDPNTKIHPWQSWIYDGTKKRGPYSIADAAAKLTEAGVPVSIERAKSWVKLGSGSRRIPADIAQEIEKLWGYKATPQNWPNGFVAAGRKKSGD